MTSLIGTAKSLAVRPYDSGASRKQVPSITDVTGTLLYYRGTSESSVTLRDFVTKIAQIQFQAVFSFSISDHIKVINSVAGMGVDTFGCWLLARDEPTSVIESSLVIMKVVKQESSIWCVRSRFGKAVWMEPLLTMSSGIGLHMVTSGRMVIVTQPLTNAPCDEANRITAALTRPSSPSTKCTRRLRLSI
ncbi:hypothetical protein LTR37_017210 [Vermiconidia calcicola]|uniref:Uncharacterized protein n=1 Tax=Vermiconidia calcicola TaxID=1690605 RepID=A0ACC3MKX4_9PEZI|nr:hypothetical protein LTR37_017210 [Vermiconidia calcicola]